MSQPKPQARFFLKELKQLLGYTVEGLTWDDSDERGFFGLKMKDRTGHKKVLWFLSHDVEVPGKCEITDQ